MEKEKKNPLQFLLQVWFHMLWTLLGLGRDTSSIGFKCQLKINSTSMCFLHYYYYYYYYSLFQGTSTILAKKKKKKISEKC